MKVNHTLKPIYDKNSKILILGSIPSIASRDANFYYAHPQNRFWKTLEKIFNENIDNDIDSKIEFLYKHNIALFDVIKSCDINSSSDSSIKNVIPNDLTKILKNSKIDTIFTTGKKAYTLYNKYIYPKTNIEAIYLPSTSPANSKKGIENILIEEYSKIKDYLN